MKQSHRKVALAAVSVLAALSASSAPALAGAEEDAFANAGYNSCDAKVLAAYYTDNLVKRVVFGAGEKILNGDGDIIAEDFASARSEQANNVALCPPEDFYSDDEIGYYMKTWEMATVSEARKKISENLIGGFKEDVDRDIGFGSP